MSNIERRVRLLVVDDHRDTVRCLSALFTSAGYSVRPAVDGKSALEAFAEETFDVVISDVGLTDMTGCDLMRKIRQQSSCVGIAISGYGSPADIERSYAAGFVKHLVKPVEFAAVLEAVANALAWRDRSI